MAVPDPADDGATLTVTAETDGLTCPDCGSRALNGQGLYTCVDCAWDGTDAIRPTAAFDHPVLHR